MAKRMCHLLDGIVSSCGRSEEGLGASLLDVKVLGFSVDPKGQASLCCARGQVLIGTKIHTLRGTGPRHI